MQVLVGAMDRDIRSAPSTTPTGTPFVAVFDLRVTAGEEELRQTLRRAYEASRSGLVGLVLGEHEPTEVDRLLDPVVEEVGPDVPGVVYLDGDVEKLAG